MVADAGPSLRPGAIEADALPPDALRRYLIIERGFVDAAITIFGYALVKAPDLATCRELVTILRGLTENQMPFFIKAFAASGDKETCRDVSG